MVELERQAVLIAFHLQELVAFVGKTKLFRRHLFVTVLFDIHLVTLCFQQAEHAFRFIHIRIEIQDTVSLSLRLTRVERISLLLGEHPRIVLTYQLLGTLRAFPADTIISPCRVEAEVGRIIDLVTNCCYHHSDKADILHRRQTLLHFLYLLPALWEIELRPACFFH